MLEIVGLEMMAEDVRARTYLDGWRKRIPVCRSYDAETTGIK